MSAPRNDVMALHRRIDELEATLRATFVAIGVANAINSVRAEYDFEPIYQRIKSALTKNGS